MYLRLFARLSYTLSNLIHKSYAIFVMQVNTELSCMLSLNNFPMKPVQIFLKEIFKDKAVLKNLEL